MPPPLPPQDGRDPLVPVPELMGTSVAVATPDFVITDPVVDVALPGGAHLIADSRRAILRVGDVGTFAIADGSRIAFEPVAGAVAGSASVWLHGTVAALLLAQRGRFALHASVIEIDGVGVAVAGPRGAGKSTTALRLMQRGHALVTDDVSPLDVGAAAVSVHPFARPLHISAQSAERLGFDVSGAEAILPGHPKLALPVPPRAPVALRAIAVLDVAGVAAAPEPRRWRGAQAHWLVERNGYRTELLGDLYRAAIFAWAGAVADAVAVHVVSRPPTGWTADDVAASVEHIAAQAGPGMPSSPRSAETRTEPTLRTSSR